MIEELVEWRTGGGDTVTDSTVWGMAFTVRDGKIARIELYPGSSEALEALALSE